MANIQSCIAESSNVERLPHLPHLSHPPPQPAAHTHTPHPPHAVRSLRSRARSHNRVEQQPPLVPAVVAHRKLTHLLLALSHISGRLLLGVADEEVGCCAQLLPLGAHTGEAHTPHVQADRVCDVCEEYAAADERTQPLGRLERRAQCVCVAHRRHLRRLAAQPQVVNGVVLRVLRVLHAVFALLVNLLLEGTLLALLDLWR
mmetsp:Transcript_65255/g.179061  ORF Transcript_65255/g.179061 Transcript_65255/m.179061 type:complete len:202 (+) Transcript_65255:1643-2248(+)